MTEKITESTFSIEMESKNYLKNLQLTENTQDNVFIEGNLGAVEEVNLHEDIMLEVKGRRGTLRLDVDRRTLEECLKGENTR